jgi:hypothetical protein
MSASVSAVIPASPLIDTETGNVMPEWRAFFAALSNRTGGSAGVDVSGVQHQIDTERAARVAEDIVLQNAITSASTSGAAANASTNAALTAETNARVAADSLLLPRAGGITATIGFQGAAAVGRQTVSGAKGGNAALGSLLTALATYGLITDSSTP